MKYLKIILLTCLCLTVVCCQDDDKKGQEEALKAEKHSSDVFKVVTSNWHFSIPAASPGVQSKIAGWAQWEQFKNELQQKPADNIGAYKQKIKSLVERAQGIKNSIPPFFNKPQMQSRAQVLITKLEMLYTYMNITVIDDKKVVELIHETTAEVISFQNQMDEMVRFSEVPKEMGEEEMLRALDTVRHANPGAQPMPGAATPNSPVLPTPAGKRGIGGHGANYNYKPAN